MNDVHTKNVLVSLPIYTRKLDLDNERLKTIIDLHRKRYPETNQSNVKAWHSDYKTHLKDFRFQPFIDEILENIKGIKQYDRHFCGYSGFERTLHLRDFWVNMYDADADEYAVKHQHFPCPYAATYYVEVEENSSPIHFHGMKQLKFYPENGTLVVWPGFLYHSVPPSKGKRTVLAMNLLVKNDNF
tara:strand:+ start:1915 stop:2472 length:558 start_codon:yes stop_codon:yes gene_type:complete